MTDKKLWMIYVTKGYPDPECDNPMCRNCRELARYYVMANSSEEIEKHFENTELNVELIHLELTTFTKDANGIEHQLKQLEDEYL